MKIRPLPLLVLSAALVVTGAARTAVSAADAQTPPPADPATVKIMFAGDSITQGFDGDYTWRYRLVTEFRRQDTERRAAGLTGVPVDFVGPKKYTYGGSNHYLVPSTGATAWDSDHDALGGTRLVDQVPRIYNDVKTYDPDVLISSLGTTDMIHDDTVDGVIKKWHTYIAKAREANATHNTDGQSDLTIVLGEVTSLRIPAAERAALNQAVLTMATQLSTPAAPVHVYDMEHANWDPSKDSYDGTHPTPTGETIIAQRVAWALNTLGVLPDYPKIWRSHVAWPPTFTPILKFDKQGRLVVNWSGTKRRNEAQYMRLRVTDLKSGRISPTPWTRDARLVRALAPGRYTIAVRGLRGTMSSVWSSPITIRVPGH